MLALLVCEDRQCRAAFEAEGSSEAIEEILCQDCGGSLHAVGYADAEGSQSRNEATPEVRRAA